MACRIFITSHGIFLHHTVFFITSRGIFYIILFSSLHHVGSFTSYCFLHYITWDLLHHTVFFIASHGIFYIILFSSLHHVGSFTSYCFLHCITWDLLHHTVFFITSHGIFYIILFSSLHHVGSCKCTMLAQHFWHRALEVWLTASSVHSPSNCSVRALWILVP